MMHTDGTISGPSLDAAIHKPVAVPFLSGKPAVDDIGTADSQRPFRKSKPDTIRYQQKHGRRGVHQAVSLSRL